MESYLPKNRVTCRTCPYYGSIKIDRQTYICQSSTAHKMAAKALARQVPIPIIKTNGSQFCPTCSTEIRNQDWSYCPSCGQKILQK